MKMKKHNDDKNLTPKEIEEQMEKILEEVGISKTDIKIITLPVAKRNFTYVLFETIFMVIINVLLFLGVNGYFHSICPKAIDVLFAALAFSGFEFVIRNVMFMFWGKSYFRYVLVTDVISMIGSTVLTYFAPFLSINDKFFTFAISVAIICIVKTFIRRYTFDKLMLRIVLKLKKKLTEE